MTTRELFTAKKAKNAKLLTTPSKRTTEAKLLVFIENYRKTGLLMRSCEAAGIDHSTHYRHLASDPNYRAAVEEAEQEASQYIEDTVFEMALGGDLQAAMFLLKRFRPHLYRERISAEVSGDITVSDMLNEARARVIAIERIDHTGTG